MSRDTCERCPATSQLCARGEFVPFKREISRFTLGPALTSTWVLGVGHGEDVTETQRDLEGVLSRSGSPWDYRDPHRGTAKPLPR